MFLRKGDTLNVLPCNRNVIAILLTQVVSALELSSNLTLRLQFDTLVEETACVMVASHLGQPDG